MICLICRQAELLESFTTIKLGRGEMHLVINNVPARVCPGCGEAYVEEGVTVRLLREAENTFHAGLLDRIIEYAGA
jgi:YgiT-type zinc finger domain-containing protein